MIDSRARPDGGPEPEKKRHPIQVVARRTGLSKDLLRAWERRYGVVDPERTDGGRRLYSDRDIEHLSLLREATDSGRRIGAISALSRSDLAELVREDRRAALQRVRDGGRAGSEGSSPSIYRQDCLAAVRALDASRLEATLSRAVVALRPLTLVEDVAGPLMREIGELWRRGELKPGHERLASGVLRSTLAEMTAAMQAGVREAPGIVVATPEGQRHELGAMLAAVTAAEAGWRVTYLGADLPTTDIAAAVRDTAARAVALSLIHPPDDPRLGASFRELGAALPSGVRLYVGGAAAGGYREVLEEIGAQVLPDIASFQVILEGLSQAAGANTAAAGGGRS